jgi:hypothetical protein
MLDDGPEDDMLHGRMPLTRGAEIAHLLGRIEATLSEMRRDIQASVKTQESIIGKMQQIDYRVIRLEGKEEDRKRFSRIVSIIALGLMLPALNAAHQLHGWFMTVNSTCFPGDK